MPRTVTYGMMPYMLKTTVYLPDALKERLERAARDNGVSEADVIRAALDEYTRSTVRPRPRLPLVDVVGPGDLAERVDERLAEGFGRT
jgi:hypothetical protein